MFRERVHRSSQSVEERLRRNTRVVGADPSNAIALIKIDDGEIARGQFDECRYPFNYRWRIAWHDDRRGEYRVFTDTRVPLGDMILFT